MKRLLPILTGSVIAAAFLGPGTVTTAARAGAEHGLQLLWTLVFATIACLVLQEASARLTIASGRDLGEALRIRFHRGFGAIVVLWLVLGAIVLGCAAYEAGNILGGVAGASLITSLSPQVLTLVSAGLAGLLLWLGSTRQVVTLLGSLVAVMGTAFLVTGVLLKPALSELASGLFVPNVPEQSSVLVLGLIGTTVVPYNLFLGSGIARGHSLAEARMGLTVAVVFGGVISMAVVVVGSAVTGAFSYQEVGHVLSTQLGGWASTFFAVGLFAAGFSSAVTAPLAAAITVRSLFATSRDDANWSDRSWRYRGVWLGVLAAGAGFGIAGVKPVPAIVLAQALNGVLLPVVAIFLWIVMNDRRLLGDEAVNGKLANVVMGGVVAVTVVLGGRGLWRAVGAVLG